MTNVKDIIGERFGKLTVIEQSGRSNRKVIWLCECDCGEFIGVRSDCLTTGNTKSCGCIKKESPSNKIHGFYGTRTYSSWSHMKTRCLNENYHEFEYYGGRGITICNEWLEFSNFLKDMGERPKDKTLDRIDVNSNYEPSNCRWATIQEQANNKRRNINYEE